jgi:hypothetical protein
MNTKDENLLVKVIKKAMGLPTGDSSCGCSTPPAKATGCCNTETQAGTAAGCACASVPPQAEEHSAQA